MLRNTISIHLVEDPVILHGSPDESVGKIISGFVAFTPTKSMNVKCVYLQLEGKVEFHKSKETWEKITTVDHTWILLKPNTRNHFLDAKTHQFPFEFALRGDLPDSVDVPHCRITYKLTAVVERPLLWNIKGRRELRIQRTFSPLSDEREITHSSLGIWAKSLFYNVSLEKGSYTPGESMPVNFKLFSKNTDFRITEIALSIRELSSYVGMNNQLVCTSEKIYQKTLGFKSHKVKEEFQMIITTPDSAHCDCSSDIIVVSHAVVAKVRLLDAFQRRWYFYIEIPFTVQSHAQHELINSLPVYESLQSFDFEAPPPPYQAQEIRCY